MHFTVGDFVKISRDDKQFWVLLDKHLKRRKEFEAIVNDDVVDLFQIGDRIRIKYKEVLKVYKVK